MTRSDYSLGLLFSQFWQEAFRGSHAIWLRKQAIDGVSAFLPAPSVSKESGLYRASCFCNNATKWLANILRIARRWCRMLGWEKGASFIMTKPEPWPGSVVLESSWKAGLLKHKPGMNAVRTVGQTGDSGMFKIFRKAPLCLPAQGLHSTSTWEFFALTWMLARETL